MGEIMLAGATGMVGQAIITAARDRSLTVLSRRAVPGLRAQDRAIVCDPAEWPAAIADMCPAVLLCALGTTIKQAGSEAAFRAVDHDLVLSVADAAHRAGARHCVAVSSVGAIPASRNFYLRTKADMEAGLARVGFERVDIMAPGLLLGDRLGPARVGEALGMRAAPLMTALFQGPLRRYRPISADVVARAMLALAGRRDANGVFRHHYDAMHHLAD